MKQAAGGLRRRRIHETLGRQIGEQRPEADRHQEKRLEPAVHGEIEQPEHHAPHHQHPPSDVKESRQFNEVCKVFHVASE